LILGKRAIALSAHIKVDEIVFRCLEWLSANNSTNVLPIPEMAFLAQNPQQAQSSISQFPVISC